MTWLRDRRGNVAIIFALTLMPLAGLIGASLDYARAYGVRNFLQTQADAAALNAAVAGPAEAHAVLVKYMQEKVQDTYGANGVIASLSVDGAWLNATDFKVDASASVDAVMVHVLPGISNLIDVSVTSIARLKEQETTYEPPVATDLEPDAGDFNEFYAYCFRHSQPGPRHARRKQMTLIADNEGNLTNNWPQCAENETLSFRLRNIRHVRAYPQLWNNPNQWPYRPEHNYYTDTTVVNGVEQFDIVNANGDGGFDILETIRCDSLAECKGASDGGTIPEGKNRTPNVETQPCAPGKYMYFGWEDRPPGQPGASATWTDPAWTDRSYDDIRIVMKCPSSGVLGERLVRLIQ